MKWGKFWIGAAILSGVLLAAGGGTAYAAVDMTFAGVPGNGHFNSGALAASDIGTEHATAKLYYFEGTSPSSGGLLAVSTGILVQGQGFAGYGKIGFALAEGTHDAWATSSLPPDPTVAADGSFTATASFRRRGNTPYGATERLVICLRVDDTGELIDGSAIVLDLIPTPVSLPVTLGPVTLYTAANYEGENGVPAKIIAPDGKQFGVTDISLSDGSAAVSLDGGDVWSPTNGVTATKNVDSSVIVFRTPAEGPTGVKPAKTLTISGKGVQIINDGVAAVYGLRRGAEIEVASFSLEVLDGGHLEPAVSGPLSFKVGADAGVAADPIEIAVTPSNLSVSGFALTDADGSNPDSSKTLGGLKITVDPNTGKVSFSGTPTEEAPETTYNVTAKTSDGRTLTTEPSLKVAIVPGEVYTASFSPSSFGGEDDSSFWTAGHDIGTVSAKVTVKDSKGDDVTNGIPVTFTLVGKDGNEIGSPWHGIGITTDEANKTVTLSGTPTEAIDPDTEGVYVKVGTPGGQVSPNLIPLNIHVDPDIDYALTTGTTGLTVPVGESFETNIDLSTSPAYPGSLEWSDLHISDPDGDSSDGEAFTWNGLTITPLEDPVTHKNWLHVSGEAAEEGEEQFTIHSKKGANLENATFTLTAKIPVVPSDPTPEPDPDPSPGPEPTPNPHPEVPVSPQPLPDQPADPEPYEPTISPSDPVIIAIGDDGEKEVDGPAAGQRTKMIYDVSFDAHIDIQGVNVQLPDGTIVEATPISDKTAHDPYNAGAGSPGTGDNFAYYYDKNHKQITFYATPAKPATYVYNVYYHDHDRTELKKQPVVVEVVEVNNYYYAKKKHGGCDAGMAGFVLLAVPVCAAIRRKNRKKQPESA